MKWGLFHGDKVTLWWHNDRREKQDGGTLIVFCFFLSNVTFALSIWVNASLAHQRKTQAISDFHCKIYIVRIFSVFPLSLSSPSSRFIVSSRGTHQTTFSDRGNISSCTSFAIAIDSLHNLNGNQGRWLPLRAALGLHSLAVCRFTLVPEESLDFSLWLCEALGGTVGCDSARYESKLIESLIHNLLFIRSSVMNYMCIRQTKKNISKTCKMESIINNWSSVEALWAFGELEVKVHNLCCGFAELFLVTARNQLQKFNIIDHLMLSADKGIKIDIL